MCGICFLLAGTSIHNHQFNFNFFQPYLCKTNVPLNQHIIQNKLILPGYLDADKMIQKLKKRGPDRVKIDQIDMFKVNHKEVSENLFIDNNQTAKEQTFGVQSILHLRGQQMYLNTIPGSYLLFNGQIWNTGNLQPIENQQNDTTWLHKKLVQCKGSKQKISEFLKQIRGDYAFVFVEGDQIFIGKDYFGKRSLLVGMGQDYLVISSVPLHDYKRMIINNQENQNQVQNQEETEQSWKLKYEAQWLSSRNKFYFQIPSNSLISIEVRKDGIMNWNRKNIHDIDLVKIQKNMHLFEQTIILNVKKLLIQGMKQITQCIHNIGHQQHPEVKVCVLFSGGIDSTLIARMLDFVLPKNQSIDLVNLSFRADAPDRQAGLIAYKQLSNLSPERKYNLILLDKTLEDIEANKQQLMQVIYPKTTHMDFNIASALNIAVTGTKSKIILTGLGADQIFSGYSRYRIAYKRAGLVQLQNQMIFDMQRLWIRNLGRDDRSIGNRSKQVRYPFLNISLWTYLRSVPVQKLTEGSGQKSLLRKIAKQFGLEKSSTFKKRAIQFGTRLAKLSNIKCFGSNRKAKGTFEYK